MKLLLDEMCSPAIAEQLRRRGDDAIAALERDDIRGLSDDVLLELAGRERRVLATFDVGDLSQLILRFRAEERDQQGVIFLSSRRFTPSADGIGHLVRALDAVLKAHPGEDDLLNDRMWLESG